MSQRILKGLIILLSIFIIGEVIYLFIGKAVKNEITPLQLGKVNDVYVPKNSVQALEELPLIKQNQALDMSALLYISNIRKGKLSKSVTHNTYEGKIVDISRNGKAPNQFDYEVMFTLNNGSMQYQLMYSKDDLDKMKVLTQNGDKQANIELSDMKIGDDISITEVVNLFSSCTLNNCIESIIIIKN